MGMLLFRTWGYCAVKYGDVVPNVCFIKNAHISYYLLLKKLFIPSACLKSQFVQQFQIQVYCFFHLFQHDVFVCRM